MMIHRRLIREMAKTYNVHEGLDPEHNVLISGVRADLVDGERLDALLAALHQKLHDAGVEDRAIYSVKNIVLELAGNIVLHGTGSRTEPELLVVSLHESGVRVWLFGQGLKSQVDRLIVVIRSVAAISPPPDHRDPMLRRRNFDLLRRALSEPGDSGGVGVLTIAALSSQSLWFKLGRTNGHSSFALRSTV